MTSNADKFAALFGTPAQNEPPPGPRKPAPVPEVGAARAPRDHDAERRAMFADLMTNIINR